MTPSTPRLASDPPTAREARADGAGFRLYPAKVEVAEQRELTAAVMEGMAEAPAFRPTVPGGAVMSVEMTNFGALGWVSDAHGYRYQDRHPLTGLPWPAIPQILLRLWSELVDDRVEPDCCLVNLYRGKARLGLHQDRDEADFSWPVLSVSLGDTAIFRLGGPVRRAPSSTLRLSSGDVCLLAGSARLAHHGIDRVIGGSSQLIPGGGRLSLTLRRAGPV